MTTPPAGLDYSESVSSAVDSAAFDAVGFAARLAGFLAVEAVEALAAVAGLASSVFFCSCFTTLMCFRNALMLVSASIA